MDTKTIKTSELTGSALDWAVAKCEGIDLFETEGWIYGDGIRAVFRPSTNWVQSGPIIEAKKIDMFWDEGNERWDASMHKGRHVESGPTLLIAAMRCYVASKLGNKTEIPKELI